MPPMTLEAVAADLTALEAVVRAMASAQARKSPTALGDLLQALAAEAEQMTAQAELMGDEARAEAGSARAVVEAWMEDLKDRAMAA